jgi:bacteriocin-like protein
MWLTRPPPQTEGTPGDTGATQIEEEQMPQEQTSEQEAQREPQAGAASTHAELTEHDLAQVVGGGDGGPSNAGDHNG